jgi:hypothetical protein
MDDDLNVDKEAQKIIEESVEMGDNMAESPPQGQKCAQCDRDAVAGPGDEWLCETHQREFFEERHG